VVAAIMSVTPVAMIAAVMSAAPVAMIAAVLSAASISVPVITVPPIATVTDNSLIPAAPVTGIPVAVFIMPFPWVVVVYYHFIAVIQVIITVSYRQIRTVHPNIILGINILMCRNVVISSDIRHIIIVSMIIPNRAPCGLQTNVYTYIKTYLRLGCFDKNAAK
jgi:hypothetical protein